MVRTTGEFVCVFFLYSKVYFILIDPPLPSPSPPLPVVILLGISVFLVVCNFPRAQFSGANRLAVAESLCCTTSGIIYKSDGKRGETGGVHKKNADSFTLYALGGWMMFWDRCRGVKCGGIPEKATNEEQRVLQEVNNSFVLSLLVVWAKEEYWGWGKGCFFWRWIL